MSVVALPHSRCFPVSTQPNITCTTTTPSKAICVVFMTAIQSDKINCPATSEEGMRASHTQGGGRKEGSEKEGGGKGIKKRGEEEKEARKRRKEKEDR